MLAIRDLYLADTVRHDACMACNISRPLDRRLTGTSTDRGVLLPFDGMRRYETDLPGGPQYITYQFGKWWTDLREFYLECEIPTRQVDLETFFTDLRSYNVYIRPNHVFEMLDGRVKCKTTRFKMSRQIQSGVIYEIVDPGDFDFSALVGFTGSKSQMIGQRFWGGSNQGQQTITDLQGGILYELQVTGYHSGSQYAPIYGRIQLIGKVWAGEHWGGDTGIGTYSYTSDTALDVFETVRVTHSTQLTSLETTIATHSTQLTSLETEQATQNSQASLIIQALQSLYLQVFGSQLLISGLGLTSGEQGAGAPDISDNGPILLNT